MVSIRLAENRRAISLLILGVLGLQGVAVAGPFAGYFTPGGRIGAENGYLWPFVDYPMYKQAYRAGDELERLRLVARLSDGHEVPVPLEALGVTFWQFIGQVVPALIGRNQAELQPFLERYRKTCGCEPVLFRLENHSMVLGRDGTTPGPIRMIQQVPLRKAPTTHP